MERYAERKPGLDKGQDCWPCMTLHLPLFSMYNLRYKSSFWKKSCRPCSPKLGLLVSFFPSLSLFVFRLIPWSAEALWVHFLARASKTLLRRCSAPSPHREGAWGLCEQGLCRGFTGFLCKPRNINLFLSSAFLTAIFSLSPWHHLSWGYP